MDEVEIELDVLLELLEPFVAFSLDCIIGNEIGLEEIEDLLKEVWLWSPIGIHA